MGIDIGFGVFGSDLYGYLGDVFCLRPPRFINALGDIIMPDDFVRCNIFQIKTPKEIAKRDRKSVV